MFGIGFVCLSVICGNYFGHWVCLFVCYLWELCWALGLSVCYLWELCWALGLSVSLLFVGFMLGIGFVCLLVG